MHGNEIEFVFGHPLNNPQFYKQEELAFAENVVKLWTNFAKTGFVSVFYIFNLI